VRGENAGEHLTDEQRSEARCIGGRDVIVIVKQRTKLRSRFFIVVGVGRTIQIRKAFPEDVVTVTSIVLAAIVIFEVIGPLLTHREPLVTGEAQSFPHSLVERT
jgi:hypothetical protein